MSEILIFINQFAVIYLLGIQSLMVRDGNYVGAALGSFAIGVSSFFIYNTIGSLNLDDTPISFFFAFIVAGPIAIVSAMWTHPKLNRHFFRRR